MITFPKTALFFAIITHGCAFAAAEQSGSVALDITAEQQLLTGIRQNKLDPNSKILANDVNMPMICAAASKGQLELLKYLHETANISLNTAIALGEGDLECCEPIHLAAVFNKPAIIDYLIKKGVNPNRTPQQGLSTAWGPLHMAVCRDNLEAVEVLLKYPKTDYNVALPRHEEDDFEGFKPLHLAAYYGYHRIIKALIDFKKNLDLNEPVEQQGIYGGFSPLHIAIYAEYIDVVKFLYEQSKVNPLQTIKKGSFIGFTPLHVAATNKKTTVLDYILTKTKASIDLPIRVGANSGKKPIHIASQLGRLDAVKYLFQNTPSCVRTPLLSSDNNRGITPIELATLEGHTSVVQYLHEHAHLSLNEPSYSEIFEGLGLIHFATMNNHLNLVRYLVSENIDANLCIKCDVPSNFAGSTPLFIAISQKNNMLVQYLIKEAHVATNGIIQHRSYKGDTLEEFARKIVNLEALQYLREKPVCNNCLKDGSQQCAGCKSVYYCSTACQKANWPAHKNACNITKKLQKYTEEHTVTIKAQPSLEIPLPPAAPEQTPAPAAKSLPIDESITTEPKDTSRTESTHKEETSPISEAEPIIATEPCATEEKQADRSPSPAKKPTKKRERTPSPQSINAATSAEKEQSSTASDRQPSPDEDRSPSPSESKPRNFHLQHQNGEKKKSEPTKRYRAQASSSGAQRELEAKQQEVNTIRTLWTDQRAENERLRAELALFREQFQLNQRAQSELMTLQETLAKHTKTITAQQQQIEALKKMPLREKYEGLLTHIRSLMPIYEPAKLTEINSHNQHYVEINDTANRLKIYFLEPTAKNSLAVKVELNKKLSKWFCDFANAFIQQGGFDMSAGKHFAEDDEMIKRTIQIHRFAREADDYVITHGIITISTNNGITTTRIDVPCLVHYLDTNKLESSSLVYLIQGTECFHRNIEPLKIELLCLKANIKQRDIPEYITNPELFRKTFLAKS